MDFIDMLFATVFVSDTDKNEKESREEKFKRLEEEASKDVITVNRNEITHVFGAITAHFMHEDPKVGIALLKVSPIIIGCLFDDEIKEKFFEEEK